MQKMEICKKNICTGCGLCVNVCPKQCIKLQQNEEGFLHPNIDDIECVNCGLCRKKCPQNNAIVAHEAEFYMAWHKDRDILLQSSSGGVFTALSQIVLKRDGLVVGATMDLTSKEVFHTIVSNVEELWKLRLSKYYQSKTDEIYLEISRYLEKGRLVLFSGTACQIAGLLMYIDPENSKYLLTVDVLCHGVTSKKVIDSYIASKEQKYRKKIREYSFRVKDTNNEWHKGSGTMMKLKFDDGSMKVEEKDTDTFFFGFNKNIFLRESCYNCKYCGTSRIADFTIADFWGVTSKRASKEQQVEGVSLMLVNSKRANNFLDELGQYLFIQEVESSEAIPYNNALVKPNDRPAIRDDFFELIKKSNYDVVIKNIFRKQYLKFKVRKLICLVGGKKTFRVLKLLVKKIKQVTG